MRKGQLPVVLCAAVIAIGCVRIDTGHRGVLWTFFGGLQPEVYGAGFHLVPPWNRMNVYDVRIQEREEDLHCLTKNGQAVSLETSVRYRPIVGELPALHTEIGQRYYEVIIAPILRSEARMVCGRYELEEISSTKREAVVQEIFDAVQRQLDDKHLQLDAIFVRKADVAASARGSDPARGERGKDPPP